MGIFFTVREKKKRAGVYQRYKNIGGSPVAGATNGIVVCCIHFNCGELGKVYCIRLDSGGTKGTIKLKDISDSLAEPL